MQEYTNNEVVDDEDDEDDEVDEVDATMIGGAIKDNDHDNDKLMFEQFIEFQRFKSMMKRMGIDPKLFMEESPDTPDAQESTDYDSYEYDYEYEEEAFDTEPIIEAPQRSEAPPVKRESQRERSEAPQRSVKRSVPDSIKVDISDTKRSTHNSKRKWIGV